MARYTKPKTRISRKFNEYIIGNRKAFKKKPHPPGQHSYKKSKKSPYAIQLAAKQKIKYVYGILEKQLRILFKEATRRKGETGLILLQLLEQRLVTVVFRIGLAPTLDAARQLVSHRHIQVNGKTVNKPSFHIKPNTKISLTPKAQKNAYLTEKIVGLKEQYKWITWDSNKYEGTFVSLPQRTDMTEKINEKSIVEFYSKA